MKNSLKVFAAITAARKSLTWSIRSLSTSKAAKKKHFEKALRGDSCRTWNSTSRGTAYRDGKGWYQATPVQK